MRVRVFVKYRNGQPAAGVTVGLYPAMTGTTRAGSDRPQPLAEGTTAEDGSWQYSNERIGPERRLILAVQEPSTGKILQRSRPTSARDMPQQVTFEIDAPESENAPRDKVESGAPVIDPLQKPLDTSDGGLAKPSDQRPDFDPLEKPLGTDDEDPRPNPEPDKADPNLPQTGGGARRSYVDILANRLVMEDNLQSAEASVIQPWTSAKLQRRTAARGFADGLLGKAPLGRRPANHFLPFGTDPTARLNQSITDGTGKIADSATERQAGITVRPGPVADLLPDLGGTLTPMAFDRMLPLIMPGNRAQARISPLDKCRSHDLVPNEMADTLPADAEGAPATPPTEESETAPATTSLDVAQEAGNIVAELGSTMITETRPSASEVADSLLTDVPTGPADATSFYDYKTLQIAWEDTWTGMVDSSMVDQVRDLYESVVETVPAELNMAELLDELSEIDELHELLDTLGDAASAMTDAIPLDSQLSAWIPEIGEKWHDLTPLERDELGFLYEVHVYASAYHTVPDWQENDSGRLEIVYTQNETPLVDVDQFQGYPDDWLSTSLTVYSAYSLQWPEKAADAILSGVTTSSGARIGRVDELITDLKTRIAEPYQFDVFAPGTYNYGLLTTYRQEWQPKSYQAGDLAGTIALAPNESRKYTVSKKTTRSSSLSRSLSSSDQRQIGSEDTARSEGEIMRRAQSSLNASTNASLGFSLGVTFSGGGTFGLEQGTESSQTKKDIRDSTRTSAQEFRDERKVEVAEQTGAETEVSQVREIQNANSELTVTYLFYELQRRFNVTERLHEIQPVVLIAYEVPTPDAIDEAWLLQHEWILRKVLLDASLHPVLRTLSQDFAGDELAVEVYEEQWKIQIAIVSDLREQMEGHARLREEARAAIQRAGDAARAAAAEADEAEGTTWQDVGLVAVGGIGALAAEALFSKTETDASAPVTSEEDSGRHALDWADTDLAAAQAALSRGISALEAATESYVQAVRDRLNRRVRVDKLILHVKSNILHYMQAIWRHEHPDERYLRFYDMEVVWPSWDGVFTYAPSQVPPLTRSVSFSIAGAGQLEPSGVLVPPSINLNKLVKLHQVADLSQLLGFKGNYGIFPLKSPNALTTTMAVDYLDTEFGITDPDPSAADLTADEAIELAECAWNQPGITEDEKREVADWLVSALEKAHAASEEIIVPTGELFIEALPGAHPLLEDFKLQHRAHDAAKASADARMAELEAVRRAARLIDTDLTDPDIDKRIEIQGGDPGINVNES